MFDPKFMKQAIKIAETDREVCSPNPFVGAVLIKDGKTLSTGYTQAYGGDHAEVQAINKSEFTPEGADLYVTLEPCCHFGKTPPCTDAIINAKIKNVYAGIPDPNPRVNTQGFQALQNAGIHVEYPFFEEEIKEQLQYYLKWITTQKPFVILKNAISLDGKIAADNGSSRWISGEQSRLRVHQLRHQVDAILTTINTVKADNPALNVRLEVVKKQPIRIILDPLLQMPLESNICQTTNTQKTIIFYDEAQDDTQKIATLQTKQIETIGISNIKEGILDFSQILTILGSKKVISIMVEAGTTLNSYLLQNGYIDQMFLFICPKILGGRRGVFDALSAKDISESISFKRCKYEQIGEDMLVVGYLV